MKNFIKILSMLVVLAMLVTALTSCFGLDLGDIFNKETEDSENVSDNTSDESESESESESQTEPQKPGIDDNDDNNNDENNDNNDNNNTPTDRNVTKILNIESFLILVDAINKNPSITKDKTYKLMIDIDIYAGWDPSVSEKLGKFIAPDAVTEFAGINEFYGVFDGNGHSISAVYMADSANSGEDVAIFKKLNGGTIKNLTVNTAFIYDDGAKGANVSGLVGTVNGDNSVIENVTVKSNVYVASNSVATVAGVVGKVDADNLTMKNVTFAGRVGVVAEDMSIDSPSTEAVLSQMIADAGNKNVEMSGCAANGLIHANDAATTDEFCAKNGNNVTKTNCTVTAPEIEEDEGSTVIEINTIEELLTLATLGSNFEGVTIILMKDMILNPNWTAGEEAPELVWQSVAEFKGVFDGNGKIISGIYGESFIESLNGGTVKNLLLLNSAFVSEKSEVGFIGTVSGGNVVDVYSEAKIYAKGTGDVVGGIAGKAEGASTIENVVFAGEIDAAGNTADLIANGGVTYKNVLAIGTGAITTVEGSCVLNEKKDEAFLESNSDYAGWSYSAYLEACAPNTISQLLRFLQLTPDTSWYNDNADEFEIYTAEQFLGFSELGQTKNFEGKTIKLMADINLNPSWNGASSVSSAGIVTLPTKANNVWTSIPTFKGTLDGNGHRVSGLYSYNDFTVPADVVRTVGGFMNEVVGGTIKNLIVDNSFSYFESTTAKNGTTRIHIGGFIGHAVDATLTTLYVDMDAWVRFDYHFNFGGMIAAMGSNGTAYSGEVKDIVFAGSSGVIPKDSDVYSESGQRSKDKIRYGGVIAANLSWNNANDIGLSMKNIAYTGANYWPGMTSGDSLLCYTSGGAYNNGIGVDNAAFYHNYTAAGDDADILSPTTLDSVANNIFNNKGASGNTSDTYGGAGWKSVNAADDAAYANGAGLDTILLPGSVVDMLVANNG